MRFLLVALLSLLCISCASSRKPASLKSVEIKEIKPRLIEEEQFKRISEYMTGKEYTGDRLILRTDPEARTGYYFTLVLDEKVRRLPSGTQIIGEFHTAKELDAQEHTFTVPAKRPKTKEIFVGLTGEDWPEGSVTPAAWRFTIKDPNGVVLATKKSYLWSL
ncbi:MAG TPA: hypothetical protein DCX06_12645 [Opitutae bacterium]|nr:hypothetical protein [Opitutae bacterium]